jgi:hypothetical protein
LMLIIWQVIVPDPTIGGRSGPRGDRDRLGRGIRRRGRGLRHDDRARRP